MLKIADDKSHINGTGESGASTDDNATPPPSSGENSGDSAVTRVPLETAAKSNGTLLDVEAMTALTQLKPTTGGVVTCKCSDGGIENGKQSCPDDLEAVARSKARGERDAEEATADDAEALLEVEVDRRAPLGGRGKDRVDKFLTPRCIGSGVRLKPNLSLSKRLHLTPC